MSRRAVNTAAASLFCSTLSLGVVSAANAHVSLVRDTVEASTRATLEFVAPAEHNLAMVGLTVVLPPGTKTVDGALVGWRFTRAGRTANWTDGRVGPRKTGVFRLHIVAPSRAGRSEVQAAQRYADGHLDRWKVALAIVPHGSRDDQHFAAAAIAAIVGVILVATVIVVRYARRVSPR